MAAMKLIKKRYGKGSVFLGAQGVSQSWYIRQRFRSPEYPTQ
ncbi:DUF4113 domain-containing protein [Halomonas elongata]